MKLTGKVLSVGEHERDDEVAHGVFVEVPKEQLREHGIAILYRDVVVYTDHHAKIENPEVPNLELLDCDHDALAQKVCDAGRMIARAIRNARPHRTTDAPRWVAVRDAFGYGSETSKGLCKQYGFDPDERVPGIPCNCEDTV